MTLIRPLSLSVKAQHWRKQLLRYVLALFIRALPSRNLLLCTPSFVPLGAQNDAVIVAFSLFLPVSNDLFRC